MMILDKVLICIALVLTCIIKIMLMMIDLILFGRYNYGSNTAGIEKIINIICDILMLGVTWVV